MIQWWRWNRNIWRLFSVDFLFCKLFVLWRTHLFSVTQHLLLPPARFICFLSKSLLHLGRSHRVSSASMRSSSLSRNFIIAFNVQCDCESIDVLRGNVVRGGCEWERKEASVLEVVRGVDGNSSLYMVMAGLLMFNVYWVQFEIESIMNYEFSIQNSEIR